MRIYFDIIFIVLNIIIFAVCGFKSRIIMKKSVENTQYKTENCRPNNSDLSF